MMYNSLSFSSVLRALQVHISATEAGILDLLAMEAGMNVKTIRYTLEESLKGVDFYFILFVNLIIVLDA